MHLSVVIPCYNEKDTIEQIIKRVKAAPFDKEIIVVDDFSTDGTRDILKNLTADDTPVRVFFHARNHGKGAALRTGFKYCSGDIVIVQDADLEYDPTDYPQLIAPIDDGKAEVVYGSRFLGVHRAFAFANYMGNKALNLVTNILYNTILTDMETGYKAFRREVIQGINIECERFNFEPEITAKVLRRGYRIYEVPISYAGRDAMEGKKLNIWKDGPEALWALIKYRFVG
jgi:glycosyltransferase involved in cell wall biosynthesis